MSILTAADVECGTAGTIVYGSGDTTFSNVSIDTRSLKGGDIFFAIRGPNQDGHRYIPDALAKGASGVVVEQCYQFPGDFPQGHVLIRVKHTHEALKDLAIWDRKRWHGILIAITGSMGKTTTKEFAAHVLGSKFQVYRTPGNYNNLFGLPLALLGLTCDYDVGIFEMGMSAAGEIEEMCRIASPKIGIITNVAPVHLEFFSSLEDIARAKEELSAALPADGTLIYNADNPLVQAIAKRCKSDKISFGFSESADVKADRIQITGLSETRFRLSCGGHAREGAIPAAGAHYVMNLLPSIALGYILGIPLDRMIETFATLQQASMRGQMLSFKPGFTVIDDSYNSNPKALMTMIEVLTGMPSFSRRILIAGEMLELGSETNTLHADCGRFAAEHGVDIVMGVRGAAEEIVRGALATDRVSLQSCFCPDADAAAETLAKELCAGDLVLVKGSRGVHLEKIIQKLRAEFEVVNN